VGGRYEGSGAKCASEIQNRYPKPCFTAEHSKMSVISLEIGAEYIYMLGTGNAYDFTLLLVCPLFSPLICANEKIEPLSRSLASYN
jgi:hypothetical protein